MNKLSVVIITFNEADNIARCIDSVREVAEEVLVVDSFSTDRTREIAQAKGARVIEHIFEGHIQQKNWAKEQAIYDWVLSLDADETLSEELSHSIRKAKSEHHADGYTMNRLNYYCGQAIKTCGWYPDKKARLWNRRKGEWTGINPHDKFVLKQGAIVKHLQGDILHNTYPTHESFMLTREKFSTISAQHLQHKSKAYLTYKMWLSPPFKFIKTYIINLGFTEGRIGFVICYNLAREVYLKYKKALQLK